MKFIFSVLFLLSTGVENSFAFTLTQDNLRGFQDEEILISLDPTNCPASVEDDLNFAIELWNNVPGSRLSLRKESKNAIAVNTWNAFTFLQTILVGCSTNFTVDSGGAGLTTIGVGTSNRLSSAFLQKGYLILNEEGGDGRYSSQSAEVKRFVMAHELGHVFGLGHSSTKAALMYPSVSTKSDTNLHQDDMDGIVYLYPIDEFSDNMLYGCGAIAASTHSKSGPPNGIGIIFLILPLILILLMRRYSFFRINGTAAATVSK